MNPVEVSVVRAKVQLILDDLGLNNSFRVKPISFQDLARDEAVQIIIQAWEPNPRGKSLYDRIRALDSPKTRHLVYFEGPTEKVI